MKIKVNGFPEIQVTTFEEYTPTPAAEVTEITTVADVSGSLGGKYFYLFAAENSAIYTVWFNVDSGNVAPEIQFTTPVEVTISANDTAADVATAL